MDSTGFPPDGASRALIRSMATRTGVRSFAALPDMPSLDERPITVDQTHRSVVVGETVVVKWFRPAQPPPHRAVDMLAHLADVGFTRTARPYAAFFDGDDLAALVAAYLPDARDGWEWCVDAAIAAERIGAGLGELVAELHVALATPSAANPAPVAIAADPDRHPRALATLDAAVAADAWLAPLADRLRTDLAPLASSTTGPVLRIHGDLHVGQVLRWRDGYAVIDFDGNPTLEADTRQPVARDVAQVTTSIAHVGQIAQRRGHPADRTENWVRETVADFRATYIGTLGANGFADLFDPELLAPFEVEQECREFVYAARFLPRWRHAPVGVLTSWYGEPGNSLDRVSP